MPKPHLPIPPVVGERALSNYTVTESGCWESNYHRLNSKYGHPESDMRHYTWGAKPPQWGCSSCYREKNEAYTKITSALRQLEIAFGVGDWHTKRSYRSTINKRNQRVLAVRAERLSQGNRHDSGSAS